MGKSMSVLKCKLIPVVTVLNVHFINQSRLHDYVRVINFLLIIIKETVLQSV